MKVTTLTVGAFQENSYLVLDEAAGRAVFVDPGDEGNRLLAALAASGAVLDAIWLTHAHLDHVGGIAAILRSHAVPVHLHPLDAGLYAAAGRQAASYGLPFEQPPPADRALAEGDTLTLGALRFTVMHTPGHAPGLCVIHGEGVAFVGDLVFAGSIGRTDLPQSRGDDMSASLARLSSLPTSTLLYPGHGPSTTLAEELASNPFLNGIARVVSR